MIGLTTGDNGGETSRIKPAGKAKKKDEKQVAKPDEKKLEPIDVSIEPLTTTRVCLVAGGDALVDSQVLAVGATEEYSGEKSYRLDLVGGGTVRMKAGGTPEHSRIITNVIITLGGQLLGMPCQPFESNLRIGVLATGLRTYPDVSVVCGQLQLDPEDHTRTTVTNPAVLIEVLVEVPGPVQQGDGDDRHAEVRAGSQRVPGEDAEASAVRRDRRLERDLHREVGDGAPETGRAGSALNHHRVTLHRRERVRRF